MLIKILELDFSCPSLNSRLYWVTLILRITFEITAYDFHIITQYDSVLIYVYQIIKNYNYPTFEVSDKKLTLLDCRDLLNFNFCSSFNSEYNLVKKL